jgi:hypothetical protein
MCCWLNGQYIYWNKSLVRVSSSFQQICRHKWGMRWRSWLRHWEFSKTWYRIMVVWSTQPLTEMIATDVSRKGGGGCKNGRCARLKTWPSSRADCLEILGASTFWNPQALSWPGQACICTQRRWRFGAVKVHRGCGYNTAQWNYILLRELNSSGLLRRK